MTIKDPLKNGGLSGVKILTRKEYRERKETALACGIVTYEGRPCRVCENTTRYSSCGKCKECSVKRDKVSYEKYKDKIKQRVRNYEINRPPHIKERDLIRRRLKKEMYYERVREYKKTPRGKAVAYKTNSARRASKKQRTPVWLTDADHDVVRCLYEVSARVFACTGIKYHVDHYIPLKNKDVCGLHVPWNMQLLPEKLNLAKGNKLPEGMRGLS